MDKYLQQILHEINTIIIPGLGALTVTKKETGEVMFMSFLKHDDGNLSKIIAEKEGISENDAKNYIAKHVREISAKLDVGDSYDMFQFGRFIKKNGEIEFENWNQYQHTEPIETKTLVLTESPVVQVVEEPAKEERVQASLDEIIEKSAPIDVSTIKPDENVYIPEEELKVIEQQQTVLKKDAPVKTPKTAEKVNQKDKNTVKIKQKKKRGALFRISAILGLLIIIGGVAAYLFRDQLTDFVADQKARIAKNENKRPNEETQEEMEQKVGLETPTEEPAENSAEQQAEVVTEAPAEVSKPVQKPQPVVDPAKAYHIIVGGFTVEGNANRFAKKFRDEGKNSVVLGKFDDKFLVSYESFSSKDEAKTALNNMPIHAWVFMYQK